MSKSVSLWKAIGWAFGGGIAASMSVLLLAGCIFGFQFTETVGRFVGVIGTLGGVAGSIVGLWMALRAEPARSNERLRDRGA